jgi:hypothetical protein
MQGQRRQLLGMNARQKEMVLRVADGNFDTLPILYNFLNYRRCDEILAWLSVNKITGNNLITLVNREFGNQILSVVKFILMKIDKDRVMKPLFLGKDYLPG